ncbi:SDR family oxidoreductase [Saxibacter everestensis]|uniref:SDR family oxidoreductase n=1 Tax=Saxibacter everestensis TaxID=2909229 RepID=A0ABY8QWR2_9MICO|nr:SDR family oxidoreductase [Brevibacteriaceae bacterium ZFBP1038]
MNVLDAFKLDGKVAAVTGANRGIGRALALALAEAGADLALLVRSTDEAEPLLVEIRALGRKAEAINGDVTVRESIVQAATAIEQSMGAVDILVNNAGACVHRPALEVTEEEWHRVVDVNLNGVWNCCQVFGARMAEQGGGNIVNIGSISSMIVNRPQWQPAYNASKAAVHQLTKSLAAEWAPQNIRVNALAPGYIKTAMAPVDDPRFKPRWIDDAPMQRAATPDELGPTIVYLASDASAFMTGSVLVIDGGYTLF